MVQLAPLRILDTALGDRLVPLFQATTAPVNGTSGTFAGVAPIGSLLQTQEPALYQNQGTLASPTWVQYNAAGGNGNTQPAIGVIAGPGSTSAFQMQGLGATITPKGSGNILLIVSGTIGSTSGTAGVGASYQLSYGTGAAPANGAALAGTQVGPIQEYTNPAALTAADINVPFSIQFFITGLTKGTTYWLDLAAKALSATGANFSNYSLTAVEI